MTNSSPHLPARLDYSSADYSDGWAAGYHGRPFDGTRSLSWRLGHSNGLAALRDDESAEAVRS